MKNCIALLALLALPFAALPAQAQQSSGMSGMGNMSVPMSDTPATFAPTRQAYTTNHQFLVKLLAMPSPIPYQQYFTLRFAVYRASDPTTPLPGAQLAIFAGMRHGLKHGFAHGMESAPKLVGHNGVYTISGMYFHMMGAWTLKATVTNGGQQGVAYFQLPCCGH